MQYLDLYNYLKSMELYYSLGFVHLKLTGFCELLSGEKGKKCFKDCNEGSVFGWAEYAGT